MIKSAREKKMPLKIIRKRKYICRTALWLCVL